MGYKRKRGFRSRVLSVIRSNAETKRLVQTGANNFQNHTVPDNVHPLVWTGSIAGVSEDDRNYFCYRFFHNQFQMFPLNFLHITKGQHAGYEAGYTVDKEEGIPPATVNVEKHERLADMSALRIGREIWLKGISFEFVLHIMPQIPYFRTKLSLIKHRRGDVPTYRTFYKQYSGTRMLDMMDTERFKIVKQWKFYKSNTHFATSAGGATKNDMIVGNQFSSNKWQPPELQVVKVPLAEAMTGPQWKEYVETNYPDYTLASMDSFPTYYTPMNQKLLELGFDGSKSTLVVKYSEPTFNNVNLYGVVRDDSSSSSQADFYTLLYSVNNGSTHPNVTQGYVTPSLATVPAEQAILRKKIPVGGAYPNAEADTVLVGVDKKCKIWIPGHLLYGGYINYVEGGNAQENEEVSVDSMFDYTFVFHDHYLNFRTWDYQTNEDLSRSYPLLAVMSDFLAVTYFQDV
jgi:hypothetical protein